MRPKKSSDLNFSARQGELKFDREALHSFDFKLESVLLDNGKLTIDLAKTNAPKKEFRSELFCQARRVKIRSRSPPFVRFQIGIRPPGQRQTHDRSGQNECAQKRVPI